MPLGHISFKNKCPNKYKKPAQDSKSALVTLSNNDAASGYGSLFPILSVCQSTDWWVDTRANFHVCVDVSLFSSYQVAQDCSVLIVQLKNVQHVTAIKKNLVSGSLLCKEGFKLVFESSKVVIYRYGLFVGKRYDCRGLFLLYLAAFCNKVMHQI